MGKKWLGHRERHGGRGGGGRGGAGGGDTGLQSCRGLAIIVGTCDSVREREANKELLNILTQAIEDMVEAGELPVCWGNVAATVSTSTQHESDEDAPPTDSVAAMLAAEVAQLRNQDGSTGGGSAVLSVNPDIKGVVVVKIVRPDVCPVKLLSHVFDRVRRGKAAISKHLIRLTPCSRCFFPNAFELIANVRALLRGTIPGLQLPPMVLPTANADAVVGASSVEPTHSASLLSVSEQNENDEESDNPEEKLEPSEEASVGEKRLREEGESGRTGFSVQELREQRKAAKRAKAAAAAARALTEGSHSATRAMSIEAQSAAAAQSAHDNMSSCKSFAYEVALKARNHNTLTQAETRRWVAKNMPAGASPRYQNPDVSMLCCRFASPFKRFYVSLHVLRCLEYAFYFANMLRMTCAFSWNGVGCASLYGDWPAIDSVPNSKRYINCGK